jgi:hypothetical protein
MTQEKGKKKAKKSQHHFYHFYHFYQKSTFDACPHKEKKKTWQLSAPRSDV